MEKIAFGEPNEEKRIEMLDANCDEVLNTRYLKKFTSSQLNEERRRYSDIGIKINEIEKEMADVISDFKERLKPLKKDCSIILDNLKQRGEYINGKMYKIIDREEKVVAFYDETGMLIEERGLLPNEIQRTTFELQRSAI